MVVKVYEELKKFLNKEQLDQILDYNSRPLPTTVRTNTLRISKNRFEELLTNYDVKWERNSFFSSAYKLIDIPDQKGHNFIFKLRMLGYIYFQNFSSMIPPLAFDLDKIGDFNQTRVIDMCASPGSKTTQLAQMMGNKGLIVANDFSKKNHRAYILHRNLKLTGALNVVVSTEDARRLGNKWKNFFDLAIVDVPCTGTGVIRERNIPDRFENDLGKITSRQNRILNSAIDLVKPGGTIIYSTCSYLPQENELVLNSFIERDLVTVQTLDIPNLIFHNGITHFETRLSEELEKTARIYPYDFDSVGFFIAKLVVNNKSNMNKPNYEVTGGNIENFGYLEDKWKILENDDKSRVLENFKSNWGIDFENYSNYTLIRNRKGRIWMTTDIILDFLKKQRNWHPPERIAVSIAQEEKKNPEIIRMTVDGVLTFHSDIKKENIVILNQNLEDKWFEGQSIDVSELNPDHKENSYVILETKDGLAAGCSRFSNNILYNFLPKFRQYSAQLMNKSQASDKRNEFYSSVLEENS